MFNTFLRLLYRLIKSKNYVKIVQNMLIVILIFNMQKHCQYIYLSVKIINMTNNFIIIIFLHGKNVGTEFHGK